MESTNEITEKVMQGDFSEIGDGTITMPFYEVLAEDLVKQRNRLGGDWAIAQAVFSRKQRDFLRQQLGPKLVFIVMNLTAECQKKRVASRHGDSLGGGLLDMLIRYASLCEPAGEDEENAYNLDIDENMTRDDVMKKLLEIVRKAYSSKETPWKNGYWNSIQNQAFFTIVDGNKTEFKGAVSLDHPDCKAFAIGTWTYGDFGKCSEDVAEASGAKNYNIEIANAWYKQMGVIDESGTKIYYTGLRNKLEIMEWCNEERLKAFREDRDPASAPPCPYVTPTPDELGKFIWLSGNFSHSNQKSKYHFTQNVSFQVHLEQENQHLPNFWQEVKATCITKQIVLDFLSIHSSILTWMSQHWLLVIKDH